MSTGRGGVLVGYSSGLQVVAFFVTWCSGEEVGGAILVRAAGGRVFRDVVQRRGAATVCLSTGLQVVALFATLYSVV